MLSFNLSECADMYSICDAWLLWIILLFKIHGINIKS